MYCEKLLPTDVAGAVSDGEGQKPRFATPPQIMSRIFLMQTLCRTRLKGIVTCLLEPTYREE